MPDIDYASLPDAEINAMIELRVFGDDLKLSDEEAETWGAQSVIAPELHDSMFQWIKARREYVNDIHKGWSETIGLGKPSEWLWKSREGRPWQSSIESHVANWRRPARNFCGDGNAMLELMEKMREFGLYVQIEAVPKGGACVAIDKWYGDSSDIIEEPSEWNKTAEIPRAVATASLRALDATAGGVNP